MTDPQYGYANSTVLCDVEIECDDCGDNFWWTVVQQRHSEKRGTSAPSRCPKCRKRKTAKKRRRRTKKTTAIVRRPARKEESPALPDNADFARELRDVVNEAHTRYAVPPPTLWESWTGNTPESREQMRQYEASESIRGLVDRERTMLKEFAKVQVARSKSAATIIRAQNEVLEVQIEQDRLQEMLRQGTQLSGYLDQEHETSDQEQETSEDEDSDLAQTDPDLWYATQRQRRKVRGRAMAEQAVISDFLKEARRIFNNSQLERSEQAVRLRSLMDVFAKGPEDLPAQIRKFLARVEDEGDDQ